MCNLNLREVSYIKKFHDGGRRVPLTNLEIPFTRTWTLEGYDENNNLIVSLPNPSIFIAFLEMKCFILPNI